MVAASCAPMKKRQYDGCADTTPSTTSVLLSLCYPQMSTLHPTPTIVVLDRLQGLNQQRLTLKVCHQPTIDRLSMDTKDPFQSAQTDPFPTSTQDGRFSFAV